MILFGLAAPAWGQSDAGREAYRRGEYATAYRIWKPLAEQGNAAAQYNLGLLYQHGLGVERQLAEAAKWYGLAAQNGDADGQTAIGDLYVEGLWGAKDYAKAAQWYRLAAEQGDAEAQRKLGVLLAQGRGVTRNSSAAIMWLRRAAEQGDTEAAIWLRNLRTKRRGGPGQLAGFPRPTTGRRCPRSPQAPYEVNVRIEIPPVPVNHEFGIAELGELSFHEPHARVLGLAKGSLRIKTSARFSAAPSGDGFCFWVTAVDVTLSYRTMEVYVAKEYGPRTCPYRVILEHEKEHVRAARRNLRRYAPRVRSALTSLLIPTGREPVAVASPEDAEREVQALSRELLEPVYEKMIESLHRSQAALDTPEQYRRVRRRCRRW
ncbi:MAG: tetratricopeptide repeat protein [Alphaproteobacteria bacterium]